MSQSNQLENNTRLIQMIVAIALAVLAGFLQYHSANKKAAQEQLQEVYLLNRSVVQGDTISESDFVKVGLRVDAPVQNSLTAEKIIAAAGSTYRRSETKHAIAQLDLVEDELSNRAISLSRDENVIRVDLPRGISPREFQIGSRVTLQLRTVDTTQATREYRLVNCSNCRIISIGEKLDRYDPADTSSSQVIRIAFKKSDPNAAVLQSIITQPDRTSVTDIYTPGG